MQIGLDFVTSIAFASRILGISPLCAQKKAAEMGNIFICNVWDSPPSRQKK